MADVIEKIEWLESDDLKIFLNIIYPYCDVSSLAKTCKLLDYVN
jgi:hypothetical protein